jgi:hypothetical protein
MKDEDSAMRPLTTRQQKLLNEICSSANFFQTGGYENQRDVSELRNWNRFDANLIEKVESKFGEISKIGEEISSLICILRDVK